MVLLDQDMLADLRPLLGENFHSIVQQFCERSNEHKEALGKILSGNGPIDYKALGDRAHGMKSIAGQLGAIVIAEAADTIEKESERPSPSREVVKKAYQNIETFLPATQEELKKWL